jgi:DNA-directed RNA polymerase subunit RPC12/RpoP
MTRCTWTGLHEESRIDDSRASVFSHRRYCSHQHFEETEMTQSLACPRCDSTNITAHDYARKIGGTVGAAAGAAGSAAAALGGAEAGAALGLVAGPLGAALGGVAGALMGALFGGALGCATGAAVGEAIDTNVLDNYECQACGHTFGRPERPTDV